jgi:hypothetical protein
VDGLYPPSKLGLHPKQEPLHHPARKLSQFFLGDHTLDKKFSDLT